MNPDFTLIWPLSCLKDGNHLLLLPEVGAENLDSTHVPRVPEELNPGVRVEIQ